MPADVPDQWIQRARSDLRLGEVALNTPGVMLEDACFHAQQSAEKALKGLLSHLNIAFPKTHAIDVLLDMRTNAGVDVPASIDEASALAQYAVQTRYPANGSQLSSLIGAQSVSMRFSAAQRVSISQRARSKLFLPPSEHAQRAQRVPAAGTAHLLHIEEDLARVLVLGGPASVSAAILTQQTNRVLQPFVTRRLYAGEILQPAQEIVMPAVRIGDPGKEPVDFLAGVI